MKWENYATAVLQSTAEFVETKLDCVCCLTVRVRQQYAPYYQGFGRQAHNYPVIFCPHLPFRGKSKNKINNNNKKLVQHEIVKGPGYVGGFWGGFDVFCLSLMTVAFLKHPFIIMYVCHVWAWRRQGSLAGLETLNTSHQAECWYISAGAGKFLYTTSSLPPSPGINRKERAYPLRAVERLEHIPLCREDRQVRLRALFFCEWMFLPIIYEGRVQFETSRVEKQKDWL